MTRTEADGPSSPHRARFDLGGAERPSTAIVCALADARSCSPIEMKPLYDDVDLDAIDSLFEHDRSRNGSSALSIEFSVERWLITVSADGWIVVDTVGSGDDDDDGRPVGEVGAD